MNFIFNDFILRALLLNLILFLGFGLGCLYTRSQARINNESQINSAIETKINKVTGYVLVLVAIAWVLSTLTYITELVLRFFGVITLH